MTDREKEILAKLTLSLDACMELVEAAAKKERREGDGMSMRPITWQKRVEYFSELIVDAHDIVETAP